MPLRRSVYLRVVKWIAKIANHDCEKKIKISRFTQFSFRASVAIATQHNLIFYYFAIAKVAKIIKLKDFVCEIVKFQFHVWLKMNQKGYAWNKN